MSVRQLRLSETGSSVRTAMTMLGCVLLKTNVKFSERSMCCVCSMCTLGMRTLEECYRASVCAFTNGLVAW